MKRAPKPQEIEKISSQITILDALKKGRMRWKDLKEATSSGIKSTRTLSSQLQELQKQGLVRRIIDDTVYPPAVSYQLTTDAKVAIASDNPNALVIVLKQMMEEMHTKRKTMISMIDRNTPVKEILQRTAENFLADFLWTLRYCFEMPKIAPYIIFNNKELYAARLENLIIAWSEKPELVKAVTDFQDNFMKEREQKAEEIFEKYASLFKDKELAKAIIKLYSIKIAVENEKSKVHDFVTKTIDNKELRKELEKYLGSSIDEKRLKTILKEPEWKKLSAE